MQKNVTDIGKILEKIKSYYHQTKTIELYFLKTHDINIVLEDSAIDYIIEGLIKDSLDFNTIYTQLSENFVHGLKLVRDRIGKNRFFITREALISPESYISGLIKGNGIHKEMDRRLESK